MVNRRQKQGILRKAMVLLGLKIFLLVEAAPNLNLKTWNEDDLTPIISPPCSANELCWNWLPVIDASGSPYVLEEDPKMQTPRIHTIRGANSGLVPWQGTPENIEAIDRIPIPASSSSFTSRLSKKDVFMSRGWGAGGMPFSVLYLSPHNSRANHGPTSVSNSEKTPKSESPIKSSEIIPISSKNIQQNYRVALRNGLPGQPRRQYSIIPQLFISYGWGPSGK